MGTFKTGTHDVIIYGKLNLLCDYSNATCIRMQGVLAHEHKLRKWMTSRFSIRIILGFQSDKVYVKCD